MNMPLDSFIAFQHFIKDTMLHLNKITIPIAIFYGERDEDVYAQSAETIYQQVHSSKKKLKGFANSKHLMTLGRDQEDIMKEMIEFLRLNNGDHTR